MNPNFFTTLEHHTSSAMVHTTTNQHFYVEGKGHINLSFQGEINMNEVYLVPSLSINVLLVGSITNTGFTLFFDNKGCTIYER